MIGLGALAAGGYFLYVRVWTTNFHPVVAGQVYRSAQPDPGTLRKWSKKYGLKSIINLRGASDKPFHVAEKRTAKELGLDLIDIRLSAVNVPSALWIRRLVAALETARRPILIHCRDGADRSGVAGVLAAMAIGGEPYDSAKGQLSAKYLHVDSVGNKIVTLLTAYEAYCSRRELDTAGWAQFSRWAKSEYHPAYYRVAITPPPRIEVRPGEAIAVIVRVRNASERTLPAGDPAKTFTLAVFSGSSEDQSPDRGLGPRTKLPKRDLAPGQSVEVRQIVGGLDAPGTYEVHFDLVEEGRTWFARQGSPMGTSIVVVKP